MIIVGLTGGIGSGKSTVARVFEMLGVPVFYADQEAKEAYKDVEIRKQMISRFGSDIYNNVGIDRKKLASEIFNDSEKKSFVESLVHPYVANRFSAFKQKNKNATYIIREAAILIESGTYKDCDQIIVIEAPEQDRINRVIERDKISQEAVLARLHLQMKDDERKRYATQIWLNDNRFHLLETILRFDNFIRA